MTQQNHQTSPPLIGANNLNGTNKSTDLVLSLNQKIEQTKEYLELSKQIQADLSSSYEQLAKSFDMQIEGKIQRLSLERDEVLLSFAKSVLSLVSAGVTIQYESNQVPEVDETPHQAEVDQEELKSPSKETFEGAKVIRYPSNFQQPPIPSNSFQTSTSYTSVASIEIQQVQQVLQPQSQSQSSNHTENQPVYFQQNRSFNQFYHNQNHSNHHHHGNHNNHSSYGHYGNHNKFNKDRGFYQQQERDLDEQKEMAGQQLLEKIKDVRLSLNGWPDSTFNTDQFNTSTSSQLTKILDKIGEPRIYSLDEQKQQMLFLEEEIECCHVWSPWPRELQKHILTLIASRLRNLQKEDVLDPFDHHEKYAKLFRKLTRFSSDHRPGFVQALSKDKSPVHSDWLQDEIEAWKALNDWIQQLKSI
jgi:hypothetical protein